MMEASSYYRVYVGPTSVQEIGQRMLDHESKETAPKVWNVVIGTEHVYADVAILDRSWGDISALESIQEASKLPHLPLGSIDRMRPIAEVAR